MAKSDKKENQSKRLREAVDAYITTQNSGSFNYKQVSAVIGADLPKQQRAVALYLAELAFDGVLVEVAPGKYKTPMRAVVATGEFVRRSNGKNSVILDDDSEPIFVAERNSMHALNGDRVSVSIDVYVMCLVYV